MERYDHPGGDLGHAFQTMLEHLGGAQLAGCALTLSPDGPAVGFATSHADRSDEFVANLMLAMAHQLTSQASQLIELQELEFLMRAFDNVGQAATKLIKCDCPRCQQGTDS